MENINIKNTKEFMSKLLLSDAFDSFFAEGVSITTFNTFTIDGRIQKSFYSKEEADDIDYEYSQFKQIRPFLLDIIKGKNTPLSFKIILHAPIDMYAPTDYEANIRYILNIRFDGGKITLVSAVFRSEFTLDKTAEKYWDKKIGQFIEELGF